MEGRSSASHGSSSCGLHLKNGKIPDTPHPSQAEATWQTLWCWQPSTRGNTLLTDHSIQSYGDISCLSPLVRTKTFLKRTIFTVPIRCSKFTCNSSLQGLFGYNWQRTGMFAVFALKLATAEPASTGDSWLSVTFCTCHRKIDGIEFLYTPMKVSIFFYRWVKK